MQVMRFLLEALLSCFAELSLHPLMGWMSAERDQSHTSSALFCFCPCSPACGILVAQQGVEPGAPPHGEHTQRGRGGTEAPLVEEAAQSYTHATHTHTHTPTHTHAHTRTSPLHTGQAGSQRSRALWGQGQGSNSLLTDRRPAPPAPSDSIPKVSPEPPHPTLCLAILSWPLASSLLLGTKRKGVPSREASIPQPRSSCWAVCPRGALRAGS